jgi:transposase
VIKPREFYRSTARHRPDHVGVSSHSPVNRTLRLSYSGRAVHRVFASQGQEAFLEGHVAAFEVLGGIPFDKIRYDNLRSAVHRVLFGRNRAESGRWLAFRGHYGFEAFYCLPGVEGAHEKGGVEGDGGRFRRTHLVPVPRSTPWASSMRD